MYDRLLCWTVHHRVLCIIGIIYSISYIHVLYNILHVSLGIILFFFVVYWCVCVCVLLVLSLVMYF